MSRKPVLVSVATLIVAAALWFVPDLQPVFDWPIFYLLFMYAVFFWVAQASSWNLFTGFSGYFSFGQGAFYGVGVYAVGVLASKQGWPLLPSIVAGGVAAAVLGLFIGLVVFRLRKLRGEIFALMTLAVAFVMGALARVSSTIDGGQGIRISGIELPEILGDFQSMIFRLGLIAAALAVITAQLVQHSRLGWGLFAIRDDEDVAETLGVPTFRFKMIALGLSTFLAGLSGAVNSLQISYVTIEDVFNIRVPLLVILMSILGGTRHWAGPIVGALVVYTLNDRLNRAGLEDFSDLIVGALLILMIVAVKEGLYLRMRERPWMTLIGAGLGLVFGLVVGVEGSAVTMLAYILLGAVVAVMLPRRRRAPVPSEPDREEAHV
ncbi:MAG TPA: branched-chain amino acid ABC transporter permease [Acidimicrobiia bacterium]|nr:branched-chain amino acid ABC transporter permease [Acidimicrobiia bacterium]